MIISILILLEDNNLIFINQMEPESLYPLSNDDIYLICKGLSTEDLIKFAKSTKRVYDICKSILYKKREYLDPNFVKNILNKVYYENKSLDLQFIKQKTGEKFRISIKPFQGRLTQDVKISNVTLN